MAQGSESPLLRVNLAPSEARDTRRFPLLRRRPQRTIGPQMTESIALEVHLQAFVRPDTAHRWVATCPMVGVVSQGKSATDARRCLQEAVEVWFESCVERGVLDQALREANFLPSPMQRSSPSSKGSATSRRGARHKRPTVLGKPFEIHLTIPAYEAATLLSATA